MLKLKVIGAVLVFFLVSVVFYIEKRRSQLEENGRYTVAPTIGTDGKFIKYKFVYGGIEHYDKSPRLKYDVDIMDGRYFVRFLSSDLDVNEIFWEASAKLPG